MKTALKAVLAFVLSALSSTLSAAPGDLDTSFDGDGIAVTTFPGNAGIAQIVVLSDGKILAVGYARNASADADIALARYQADGSLDTTFGASGTTQTDLAPGQNDFAGGVAVVDVGGADFLYVVGAFDDGTNEDMFLARYTFDGVLDTSFGTNGVVTTAVPATTESPAGIVLDGDSRLLTGGFSGGEFFAAAYGLDGALDASFGGDGFATLDIGAGNDFGRGIGIQEDGKFLVVGETAAPEGVALARYNADGALDTGFDGDGVVVTDVSSNDAGYAVLAQPDGKLVVGGFANDGATNAFLLLRYNADGSLDTGFDADGARLVSIGGGQDIVNDLALQADGKIIAVGESSVPDGFGIARLNADGSLDTTFSGDGLVLQDFSADSKAESVAVAADGRIVVGGTDGNNFAIARFEGDSADLSVTQTLPETATVGDSVTVTATVLNGGTVAVGGVVLTDVLPSGLAFASGTSGCTGTATVACDLGTLDAGASTDVTLTLTAEAAGTLTHTVSVSGPVIDTDDTNNAASASITVSEAENGGGGGCGLIGN